MAVLAEEGSQKVTAESLLSRVERMSGVDVSKRWLNYIDILPGKEHRCWIGSLVELLMEAGLYVMRHGEPMHMQDEPVHRFLQLTGSESKALRCQGYGRSGWIHAVIVNLAYPINYAVVKAKTAHNNTIGIFYDIAF